MRPSLLPLFPLLSTLTATLPTTQSQATTATLYATHYSGSIYTLSLSHHLPSNSNDSYSLSLSSTTRTCGSMPSWLTFDSNSGILYCSDETGGVDSKGGLFALVPDNHHGDDDEQGGGGGLKEVAKVVTPGGGVSSVVYGEKGRREFLAVAHYSGAAVSTFALPLEDGADALQVFEYDLSEHGPHPQQNTPHPHDVILDPTGRYILVCDLGSDVVRVYAIDQETGKLTPCPSIERPAGSGPRHGVFWAPTSRIHGSADTMLYIDSELGKTVTAFSVSYPASGCPAFEELQDMVPYPGGEMAEAATPSEIRLRDDSVYVSIRSDQGFPPNDSISTLTRSSDGKLAFDRLTSADGTVPRTLVINKAGDLVAIGDQSSSNVAVVKRDLQTGKLGDMVANLQVGQPGEVGTAQGLSSIIWAE